MSKKVLIKTRKNYAFHMQKNFFGGWPLWPPSYTHEIEFFYLAKTMAHICVMLAIILAIM